MEWESNPHAPHRATCFRNKRRHQSAGPSKTTVPADLPPGSTGATRLGIIRHDRASQTAVLEVQTYPNSSSGGRGNRTPIGKTSGVTDHAHSTCIPPTRGKPAPPRRRTSALLDPPIGENTCRAENLARRQATGGQTPLDSHSLDQRS